jgi:hypothetical protein
MRFDDGAILLCNSLGRNHFLPMSAFETFDEPRTAARARINEIGEILALGLIRLRAKQSSQISRRDAENSLDCLGHQSGHANGFSAGKPDHE